MIVAELAANAVTHGRVPGRDFELRLALVTGSVRVEVTDTRPQPRPPAPADVRRRPPCPLAGAGRGLLLVDALADRWEVVDREPPPGKTVRAEVDLPGWLSLVKGTGPRVTDVWTYGHPGRVGCFGHLGSYGTGTASALFDAQRERAGVAGGR
ncbi:hypothetical protein SALBM311S_01724 [Streptomyces alboniger]